jgi:hypothetical protein
MNPVLAVIAIQVLAVRLILFLLVVQGTPLTQRLIDVSSLIPFPLRVFVTPGAIRVLAAQKQILNHLHVPAGIHQMAMRTVFEHSFKTPNVQADIRTMPRLICAKNWTNRYLIVLIQIKPGMLL